MTSSQSNKILLTVDVEDWFQVENLREHYPHACWDRCSLRVEGNVNRLLDLFDELAEHLQTEVKATFFVLGWVAERCPRLIREIHERGHEVASHGYNHHLCTKLNYAELRDDLIRSRTCLEQITGDRILGYRAPSFSITEDLLKVLEDTGYAYDSSFNSFSLNSRYGTLEGEGRFREEASWKVSDRLSEIPISNLRVGDRVFPLGGGGYFRLYPLWFFQWGIARILQRQGYFLFYLHPWEIDEDQPQVQHLKMSYRFRHYVNIKKNYGKLRSLMTSLQGCDFITCQTQLGGNLGTVSD